ncbi:hypothetical protein KIH74_21345 [Kineosporia sp. J2-2]|uniref:Uncharacterized protein n=1 Tax=Kineosporia corallincola TaxID=2835133 RepID=A0ABS5TK70_9ACTN|nr:hypothetical protein [Kineosporia corallincola]MBT0771497.1 hypothetical protein [Kineosporia corallincola]
MTDHHPEPDQEDIAEAEIVEDDPVTAGTVVPLPAEARRHPGVCFHGCGCGIHTLVSGNLRMPARSPRELDNGEMSQLFAAARRTTGMLSGHRKSLQEAGVRLELSATEADLRLDEFRRAVHGNGVGRATGLMLRLERDYRLLPPEFLRAPGVVIHLLALAVFGTVLVFDFFFFYRLFTDLLRVPVDPSPLERAPAQAVSLVLPLALVLAGRLLSAPVWRLLAHWRRPPGPDTSPWAYRALRVTQVVAICAFPLYLLVVLVNWAVIRGEVMRDKLFQPVDQAVVALVLLLAVTTVAVEVMISNPYVTSLARARKDAAKQLKQVVARRDAARAAIGEQEHAWRALRILHDDLLGRARSDLGRVWEMLILPSRFVHGRAGDVAPALSGTDDVVIDLRDGIPAGSSSTGQAESDVFQFFSGIRSPMPLLGPLDETARRIRDLDPARKLAEWHELGRMLVLQARDPAVAVPDPEPAPAPDSQPGPAPESAPETASGPASSPGFPTGARTNEDVIA